MLLLSKWYIILYNLNLTEEKRNETKESSELEINTSLPEKIWVYNTFYQDKQKVLQKYLRIWSLSLGFLKLCFNIRHY